MIQTRLPHLAASPRLTGGDDRPRGACYGLAESVAPDPTCFDLLIEYGPTASTRYALPEAKALCASCELCTCEPTVWQDGSVSHEDDCPIYPWCPHEMGAYTCGMPCACRCDGCLRLTLAHSVLPTERSQA